MKLKYSIIYLIHGLHQKHHYTLRKWWLLVKQDSNLILKINFWRIQYYYTISCYSSVFQLRWVFERDGSRVGLRPVLLQQGDRLHRSSVRLRPGAGGAASLLLEHPHHHGHGRPGQTPLQLPCIRTNLHPAFHFIYVHSLHFILHGPHFHYRLITLLFCLKFVL